MKNIYKRIERQNHILTYRIDDPWIEIQLFSSKVVKLVYIYISKFKKLIPDDNTNPHIRYIYDFLWHFYILFCHTPVSTQSIFEITNTTLDDLRYHIEKIKENNIALGKLSKKILRIIMVMKNNNFQNKILNSDLLQEIQNKKGLIIINTRCGRYELLSKFISKQLNILHNQILTESEFLRSYISSDHLVLFGPIKSYTHDILTSLMYKKIHYLVNDTFKSFDFKNICFSKSFTREIKANYKIINLINANDKNQIEINLEPPLNEYSYGEFDIVLNNFRDHNVTTINSDQVVNARLAFLTTNMFVFLANDKNIDSTQRSLIFDRDTGEPDIIEKDVSHFNVGDYVILRTEGGGSLLIPYADEILGENAQKYRRLQKKWKEQLELKVRNFGIPKIVKELKSDLPIISEGNINRWIYNEKQIGLGQIDHFKIILKYIAYNHEEIEETVKAIKLIKSAHQSAGSKQSHELLEQIKNNVEIDSILREKGVFKIQLKSRGLIGGAMTIFRILDFDNREHRMPYSKCDTPYYRS